MIWNVLFCIITVIVTFNVFKVLINFGIILLCIIVGVVVGALIGILVGYDTNDIEFLGYAWQYS